MPLGSRLCAALIAACTSRAAPLISRSKLNSRMIRVLPSELLEVISLTPAMRPSERSSGGHRRGHGFRRRARQGGADHDYREIHLRERGHRQQPEAENAAQGNGKGD